MVGMTPWGVFFLACKLPYTKCWLLCQQAQNWLKIKWSASFKLNLDIKMVYDFHLFGEDYFEFSLISKDTIETSAAITASVVDDEGENPFKTDLLNGKGKVSLPAPIPGLEVYTNFGLPVELN